MNEKDNKLNKGSFLYINDEEKAEWGYPEGYPYKAVITEEVLAETSIECVEDGGMVVAYDAVDCLFVDGIVYNVIFDGTVYECVYSASIDALGNISLYPGMSGGANEPFLIVGIHGTEDSRKSVFASETGTHTIAISGTFSKVFPMADKFLNQPTMLVEIVENVKSGTTEYITKVSHDDIRAAVQAGYMILGYCHSDGYLMCNDLVNSNELHFTTLKYISDMSAIFVCYTITDDGVTRINKSVALS